MDNFELVPISLVDVNFLDKTEYRSLSLKKRKEIVNDSNQGRCKGEFFRFFIIKDKSVAVGVINMYGHGNDTISVAPEIVAEYRNKGYATKSLNLAYSLAKEKEFKIATADIKEDNVASWKLHEKLGFELIEKYINKKNYKMRKYSKTLFDK